MTEATADREDIPENSPSARARWNAFLERVQTFDRGAGREENFFQIGAKGHFENPTTELLEFFLDASRSHEFGTQVLDTLLEVAQVSPQSIDTKRTYSTRREVVIGDSTTSSGRLDLVVESDAWVIVLENKIRHHAINDFEGYKAFAEKKGKPFVLLLLSVRSEVAPPGWISVLWSDLIAALRSRLGLVRKQVGSSKWEVFLREFLDNIADECGGSQAMEESRFDFARDNAGSLFQAQELFQEYLQALLVRTRSALENPECVQIREARIERPWSGIEHGGWRCVPLRFVFAKPDLEVVLKVFSTGRYGLNIYPRLGTGRTRDQIRDFFPGARIEDERGYLACVIGASDTLVLEEAEAEMFRVIDCFGGGKSVSDASTLV